MKRKDLILTEDTIIEGPLVCGNITGKHNERFNLTVKGNITAWDINARNITARNITARNITARNITAWDINARNINAVDINARNITAWNINARNISYYVVCFAYKDIVCDSIEGRRTNSKHFCLDGKITISKKKKKVERT